MATSSVVEDKYRSHLNGEEERETKWRYGSSPNYDLVNKLFEEGRTKIWPAGSVEEKVQNLVKTWEMEMFHKTSFEDYKTVDPQKYRFSLNGRKVISLEGKSEQGEGYNSLLQTSLPEKFMCYNPNKETFDSAHKLFTTTFPRGFALEILKVYSGPPVIVYKFRHWGFMEGPFKGHAPTGDLVEFFGMAIFELTEPLTGNTWKLEDFEAYPALLVMFICNHCPFVIHLKKDIVKLSNYYMKKGLAVVAISSNSVITHPQDGPEFMAEDAKLYKYPFPYLYDKTQEVAREFGAVCTPEFFLFKKDGRRPFELVYHGQFDDSRPSNKVPITGRDLNAAIDRVLSCQPLPAVQKPSVGCSIKWHPEGEV